MAANFYTPADSPEDWQALLGDPIKHWRTGYSAKSLAYSWTEAGGFPNEVKAALDGASGQALHSLEFLMGFPEHQVPLPGGSTASQNDIFILAKGEAGLVCISVEGKVSEPFDRTVAEWNATPTAGRKRQLAFLCETLGLDIEGVQAIRYQLLHRTASALIEANRFCARHAVMLVHSFSQAHEWFDDYSRFAALYGIDAELNAFQPASSLNGVALYLGWVTGNSEYLNR